MSTRSTKALVEQEGLAVHLYHEMHDGLCHLELEWDNDHMGSNSHINVIVPTEMVPILTKILEKANV